MVNYNIAMMVNPAQSAAGWQVRHVLSITFSRTGGKKYFIESVFKTCIEKSLKNAVFYLPHLPQASF